MNILFVFVLEMLNDVIEFKNLRCLQDHVLQLINYSFEAPPSTTLIFAFTCLPNFLF